MSDPDRLAEIKSHRDLMYAANVDPLHFVDIRIGDLDWLVGEIERLRALLEPSVTMTSPTVYDPANDEASLPRPPSP